MGFSSFNFAGILRFMGMAKVGMATLGPMLPVSSGARFAKERTGRYRRRSYAGDHPPNRTGWWQRHADISPMPITERMLMRHGWYRRQLRQKGVAIDPNAKNAMVLR